MAKKAAPAAATKAGKSTKDVQTPEKRSTRLATATATPLPAAAAAKPTSASKKRKTAEDFLEGGDEGVKKVRALPAKKAAPAARETKEEKKVVIAKPAVTASTTTDEVPLPTTKKAAVSKGKKVAGKKAVEAEKGAVQPSVEKPADGLKSALKKPAAEDKVSKKAAPAKKAPAKKAAQQDDDGFVHGFSSSEGEESDDDDSDVDMDVGKGKSAAVDVKTLPTIAKDDKSVQRKLTKAKKKQVCHLGSSFRLISTLMFSLGQDNERGVLYLGRIPHGFYEDEMKAYFSQFGDVTRLRLARNRKVGIPRVRRSFP